MKRFLLSCIVSVALYLGAIYLYKRGYYWLLGLEMICLGIFGLIERWRKTHDFGYVLLLTLIYLGVFLSAFWLGPQGIVGPGGMFLLLITFIIVLSFGRAKD